MIIEDKNLRNKYHIFSSRRRAGFLLGYLISKEDFNFLGIIPAGGVPIALGLLENPLIPVNKELDLIIVRKIQIPGNTEAGMGAVTPDGQIFLNDNLLDAISIKNQQLEIQIERAKQQIEKRRREFHVGQPIKPQIDGKKVLIVDDGIASGFSLLAASKWLKSRGAKKIIIAVPTGPLSSIKMLESNVGRIFCLNIRDRFPFAVADAYTDWYDLTIDETKSFLKEIEILKQIT